MLTMLELPGLDGTVLTVVLEQVAAILPATNPTLSIIELTSGRELSVELAYDDLKARLRSLANNLPTAPLYLDEAG